MHEGKSHRRHHLKAAGASAASSRSSPIPIPPKISKSSRTSIWTARSGASFSGARGRRHGLSGPFGRARPQRGRTSAREKSGARPRRSPRNPKRGDTTSSIFWGLPSSPKRGRSSERSPISARPRATSTPSKRTAKTSSSPAVSGVVKEVDLEGGRIIVDRKTLLSKSPSFEKDLRRNTLSPLRTAAVTYF